MKTWQASCTYYQCVVFLKLVERGRGMDTERAPEGRVAAEAAETELIRCSSCHRELRSPAEWICGDQHLLCDVCYQNLLNPNKKINFEQ